MKKIVLGIALVMTTVVVSALANTNHVECCEHEHLSMTSQVSTQGTHCSGIVGCSCSGFSPITNGDIWQESYCKNCGHKKSQHK